MLSEEQHFREKLIQVIGQLASRIEALENMLSDEQRKDYESKLAGQQIDHYDTINFDFEEELKKLKL